MRPGLNLLSDGIRMIVASLPILRLERRRLRAFYTPSAILVSKVATLRRAPAPRAELGLYWTMEQRLGQTEQAKEDQARRYCEEHPIA